MGNSFYYFFSATPQVLGGILALFGVFVIFKIQNLKSQMIGIGQSIVNEIPLDVRYLISLSDKEHTNTIIKDLEKSIQGHDIKNVRININRISNPYYGEYLNNFNGLYKFLHFLIKRTITWSIFTAGLIVLCLAVIPLGNYILNHSWFLYFSFGLVIVCLVYCFYGLISILRRSLLE